MRARFRDVLKLCLVIAAGDAQIDMRVRLGEALRYLRQPLRERARERDDMERPFFQLLQVRKMRLEPALARAHFLNPREKRGASCGVCPVHCPGRTSRALPPRDDSLSGGGRRRAVPSVLQRGSFSFGAGVILVAVVGATLVEGCDGNTEAPSSAGMERLVSRLASDSNAQ